MRRPCGPKGTVGHFQRGQANMLDLANVEIVDATDEIDLLFQRKLLEHRIRASFNARSRERRRLRPNVEDSQMNENQCECQLALHPLCLPLCSCAVLVERRNYILFALE